MDPEASVRAILVDPFDSQTVYAADWFMGVYVSHDAGESWKLMNDGLSVKAILSFAASRPTKTLYAGSFGGGVFKWPLNGK
jgi:hypothetical protein